MLVRTMLCGLLFSCAGALAQPQSSSETLVPRSLIEALEGRALPKQSRPRTIIPLGMEIIKYYEGWRADPYDDPVKFCTIGFGHLIGRSTCKEIEKQGKLPGRMTLPAGEALLEQDSQFARSAVMELVQVPLSDEEFSALGSFVFNVGSSAFSKSTMLKLINVNEKQAASREFRRWVSAQKVVLNGLIARRGCEAALFRGELTLPKNGKFDPKVCASLGVAPSIGDVIDIDIGE